MRTVEFKKKKKLNTKINIHHTVAIMATHEQDIIIMRSDQYENTNFISR